MFKFMILISLVGCGVPGSKSMADLSEKDREAVCKEMGKSAPTEETDCGDGVTSGAFDQGDCVDALEEYAACGDLTVGDVRDCNDVLNEDVCDLSGLEDDACKPLVDCINELFAAAT